MLAAKVPMACFIRYDELLSSVLTGLLAMLSAPKSQRFLRFAIAMPIADPRNRAISETRESNVALRFEGAMESR